MNSPIRKMSEILKELAQLLLVKPNAESSSEAVHAALLLAHAGWNRSLGHDFQNYAQGLRELAQSRPSFWRELRSSDPEVLIEKVQKAKLASYPTDRRIVVLCASQEGRFRVEWCEEGNLDAAKREAGRKVARGLARGDYRPIRTDKN